MRSAVSHPVLSAPRSRPRDTWRWLRWDLPLRVVPMLAVPLALVAFFPLSADTIGLSAQSYPQQLLLAAILSPLMGWISWKYRKRYVRRVVVPTTSDNILQSLYYVALNAPAEELFFRGVLIGWLQSFLGTPIAWLLATLSFGLYHVPARWGRAAEVGVMIAGALFGLLFLLYDSLLLPIIVHAFATCGFLSMGPWVSRLWAESRARQAEATQMQRG